MRMGAHQALKKSAGLVAVASFLLLAMLYAEPISAAVMLPIPKLSLGAGSFSWSRLDLRQPEKASPKLIIPKLGVEVAVVPGVSVNDRQEYDVALQHGVALAKGSADPISGQGNAFIFGHSSKLGDQASDFDTIFASLPSLKENDTIEVVSGDKKVRYAVQESKSIAATDVQYLGASDQRQVTLITCWPIGTNYKRWVVVAHEMKPL